MNNFLENPSQEGTGQQSEEEQEELNVDIVKEEQIMQTSEARNGCLKNN